MIKVYDKAQWQIENGLPIEKVLQHFNNMFKWLHNKGYLSNDGKEMVKIGIDSSISLNERMVTAEGNEFLDKYYDKYIEQTQYEVNLELFVLDKFYKEYLKNK